jgi:hypothetical protein
MDTREVAAWIDRTGSLDLSPANRSKLAQAFTALQDAPGTTPMTRLHIREMNENFLAHPQAVTA